MKLESYRYPSGLAFGLAASLLISPANGEQPPTLQWVKQVGTARTEEFISRPVLDKLGHLYIPEASSSIAGTYNANRSFIHQFDLTGNVVWSREVGSSSMVDYISEISSDEVGSVYVAGMTKGIVGGANAGGYDAYMQKYDVAGNVVWSKQFGSSGFDFFDSVASGNLGHLYAAGYHNSGLDGKTGAGFFLTELDNAGDVLWAHTIPDIDGMRDIIIDANGHIIMAGETLSDFGGPNAGGYDACLAKFDGDGNLIWAKQYGGGNDDTFQSIVCDAAGSIYALERGGVFNQSLSKFDAAGNRLWSNSLSADSSIYPDLLNIDDEGNLLVSGSTYLSLGGPNAGGADVYVQKYSSDGNLQWTYQLGSPEADFAYTATDGQGNIYLAGSTDGGMATPNAGGKDPWLALVRETPLPAGDFDGNGVVDGNDFLWWQRTFGSTTALAADADGSGVIDAGDLAVWKTHFGQSTNTSASVIPEPGGALMLLAGILFTPLRARSRYQTQWSRT